MRINPFGTPVYEDEDNYPGAIFYGYPRDWMMEQWDKGKKYRAAVGYFGTSRNACQNQAWAVRTETGEIITATRYWWDKDGPHFTISAIYPNLVYDLRHEDYESRPKVWRHAPKEYDPDWGPNKLLAEIEQEEGWKMYDPEYRLKPNNPVEKEFYSPWRDTSIKPWTDAQLRWFDGYNWRTGWPKT